MNRERLTLLTLAKPCRAQKTRVDAILVMIEVNLDLVDIDGMTQASQSCEGTRRIPRIIASDPRHKGDRGQRSAQDTYFADFELAFLLGAILRIRAFGTLTFCFGIAFFFAFLPDRAFFFVADFGSVFGTTMGESSPSAT